MLSFNELLKIVCIEFDIDRKGPNGKYTFATKENSKIENKNKSHSFLHSK